MSDKPYITFSNITLSFGEEQVLNSFSFEAKAGRHTVLKGESGSGKSTILKLLLGFLSPSSGKMLLNGSEVSPQKIRELTAWLPQDLNLGSGTVREVMDKPFKFSINKSQNNRRAKQVDILQQLGLSADALDKQFRDLSTGQRQRVGLAICYLLDKPLLLLDEPTSALDSASKQRTAQLLIEHTNKTVISTSHDSYWVKQADNIIEIP